MLSNKATFSRVPFERNRHTYRGWSRERLVRLIVPACRMPDLSARCAAQAAGDHPVLDVEGPRSHDRARRHKIPGGTPHLSWGAPGQQLAIHPGQTPRKAQTPRWDNGTSVLPIARAR